MVSPEESRCRGTSERVVGELNGTDAVAGYFKQKAGLWDQCGINAKPFPVWFDKNPVLLDGKKGGLFQ